MGFKLSKKYYIVIEEYDPLTETKTVTKTKVDEDTAEKILHPLPDYSWDRDTLDRPVYDPRREKRWGW